MDENDLVLIHFLYKLMTPTSEECKKEKIMDNSVQLTAKLLLYHLKPIARMTGGILYPLSWNYRINQSINQIMETNQIIEMIYNLHVEIKWFITI